jgi:RimJ/RimL family protein N-acetyltransferase
MKNAFLIGERIYLRPGELEDMELFLAWFNDPELRPFLARFRPMGRAEERWDGRWWDVLGYGILENEWRGLKA